MRLIQFFVLTLMTVFCLALAAAPGARASDEAEPKSVEDFAAKRNDYAYHYTCTDSTAKVGWVFFRKLGKLDEGVRFLVLADRVIGPQKVSISESTQGTIDTGDFHGNPAHTMVFHKVTTYKSETGAVTKVVARDDEKKTDFSTTVESPKKPIEHSIRCVDRHVSFDNFSSLVINYKETTPHVAKVEDTQESKNKAVEDYLWRQVKSGDGKADAK
ncbi:MAG: hypothetical protein HY075_05385 [Deltaproteobacteria bacterium]|nr:hypothetical protein [Deltaproteobacteria bacterium]